MLLHIPHSSTRIPEDIRSSLLLTDAGLAQEILRMTDWFTDVLFDTDADDTKRLIFPVSRLVCDPERFVNDTMEPMALKGMGAIYTRTSEGKELRGPLSAESRQRLLERFYEPHHAALEDAVQSEINERGSCLIIDCHSFSSVPLPHEPDQRSDRPQLCIGIDDFHTPDWLVRALEESASSLGWTTAVNRPFSGTIVPISAYKKESRVLSVMLELNRSLYLDEWTGERSAGFDTCRNNVAILLLTIRNNMPKK